MAVTLEIQKLGNDYAACSFMFFKRPRKLKRQTNSFLAITFETKTDVNDCHRTLLNFSGSIYIRPLHLHLSRVVVMCMSNAEENWKVKMIKDVSPLARRVGRWEGGWEGGGNLPLPHSLSWPNSRTGTANVQVKNTTINCTKNGSSNCPKS